MNKLNLKILKLFCLLVIFMFNCSSASAKTRGPGTPLKHKFQEAPNSVFVDMTITNCAAGTNYFEYKVNVTNNSTAAEVLYLNTMTFRMNHSAAIVPAGTNTYTFGYVASSADAKVAPWYQTKGTTYNSSYTTSSRLMQLTYASSVLGNSGATVNCPIQPGETVCLGKFRLTITNTNFVAGQSVGLTWVNTSGIAVYVGNATTTSSLNTTTFRSLGTPCSANIQSPCSATSSSNSATACSSYLWNGTTYTSSGTYTKTGLINSDGCDSTTYLNLTINPLPDATISSSGSTTFTYGNTVSLSAPSIGTALTCNGSSNFLSIPSGINSAITGNTITAEGWFNISATFNLTGLITEALGVDNNVKFGITSGVVSGVQKIYAGFTNAGSSTTVTSSVNLPLNTWTHIAATYDGASLNVYINGTLTGTVANSSGLPAGLDAWYIGKAADGSSYFPGTIDELRIWNVARSQTEINNNKNTTISEVTSGLVGYYKLDETSGVSAADATGNGFTGSLN